MTDHEAFERAFAAATLLLGGRFAAAALWQPSPGAEALERWIGQGDRAERVTRLASVVAPLVASLGARRLA